MPRAVFISLLMVCLFSASSGFSAQPKESVVQKSIAILDEKSPKLRIDLIKGTIVLTGTSACNSRCEVVIENGLKFLYLDKIATNIGEGCKDYNPFQWAAIQGYQATDRNLEVSFNDKPVSSVGRACVSGRPEKEVTDCRKFGQLKLDFDPRYPYNLKAVKIVQRDDFYSDIWYGFTGISQCNFDRTLSPASDRMIQE